MGKISADGDQTYSELGLQFAYAELQIKEGTEDNSKIIFPFSLQHVVPPH